MPLNADTLLDRLHLKGQVTRWRIIAIVIAVVALVALAEKFDHLASPIEGDYIARLSVEGVIMDDPDRDELLKDIKENKRIKALIVRLDTPGGSAVGGEEFYLALRDIAKVKPVVAVMRSMSTSAGYMIALGTDHIIAREGTVTGSIGVILQTAEFTGLAEKLGITPITVKSGPLKGSPSPFEKMTPQGQAALQAVVQDFFDVFVGMVAERRNMPRELAASFADGRIFTGRQALKNKLIDQIGGEEEAKVWLTEQRKISSKLDIKDIKIDRSDESLMEKLGDYAQKTIISKAMVRLDGLVLIWHPTAL